MLKTKKPKSSRTSAPSHAPVGLTAEKIRKAALRLIDKEGIEAFSTRKLGRALGCEAMAIYWYFPSKDALLDGVVDLLVANLGLGVGGENPDWVAALRQVAHAYRGIAHTHPRAFPLLATRRFATEGAYAFLEQLFELARSQGIPDRTTARFFRVVNGYCGGVALDELAGLAETKNLQAAAAVRARFPQVSAVSSWLEPEHYDDVFSYGLEILLAALAREARTNRRFAP